MGALIVSLFIAIPVFGLILCGIVVQKQQLERKLWAVTRRYEVQQRKRLGRRL
jgi:hypothetical protein